MLTGELRRPTTSSLGSCESSGVEPAKTNSQPGQSFQSLAYDLSESDQYVAHLVKNHQITGMLKGGFRWFYLCIAGIGSGIVAVFIAFALKKLTEAKVETQSFLFDQGHSLGIRYVAWMGACMGLVAIAGALVCYVEPLASGSGIPEIKCILNGIDLPNVLLLRTLAAKAFGIICSVGAGLPCGKEGPMIHSGAIVAATMSRFNAGPLITPYRLNSEARDFVAAGAAAGVAAAFGAPIGGVLFAVEEGATHMNPTILVRTFVCASVAGLTVRFFAGPMDNMTKWGTLGTAVPVEFGRFQDRSYFMWELPIFAAMGVFGGLLGALFNAANTKLSKLRMRFVGPRGHVRFLEVLVVTLVIATFNFFAPLFLADDRSMEKFSLSQRLFVDAGGEAIKDLFHSHVNYDLRMLLFFAVMHYLQTIWTYGLGVPSGLFVPSLLAGASFGRILGQGMQAIVTSDIYPGVYALIGATAMLSGMARITISLVVILMETTGEAEWVVPIFVTVMTAKWTGDLFNKGIYDIHIDLRNVPLLEHRPEKDMLGMEARNVMATNVKSVSVASRVEDLVEVLESCRHNGFPVIEPQSGRFIGLLDRSTLMHVLLLGREHGVFRDSSDDLTSASALVPYEAMVRHGHPDSPSLEAVSRALESGDYCKVVDLRPYTNRGCYTVQEHAAAYRCQMLFRTMGLRHLPVLGEDHLVRGIITRKDLYHAAENPVSLRESLASKCVGPRDVVVNADLGEGNLDASAQV
mmetsp:Transcript_69800/g.175820  ORF Transcript_69800/g.175820 Transcript_69800/m.175820 type:complete len:746 (+) Transcript_69800:55-2292(+)